MLARSDALSVVRAALTDTPCWVVGGAVRDGILGRPVTDVDLALDGDVRRAAAAVARAVDGPRFELSAEFGAWRVIGPGWQVDLNPLRGATIAEDLAVRDLTLNAMAEPLHGGQRIDPFGGAADLAAGVARAVGPAAFIDDPLRVVRLARIACELNLTIATETVTLGKASAGAAADVAQERVFAELCRLLEADDPVSGVRLLETLDLLPAILPELDALRGVTQSAYHHLDVYEHTLVVLDEAVRLGRDAGYIFGRDVADAIAAVLNEPLADQLTRQTALRFGALFHDIAKPLTRTTFDDGRVGFPGHDEQGVEIARTVIGRLRGSERLQRHVGGLTRHHLALGFLVHQEPLGLAERYDYLHRCGDVGVDVSVLSVADRLATRGRNAEAAIARHCALACDIMPDALRRHVEGPPTPVVRGDELAAALDRAPGPWLGAAMAQLARAQFTGHVTDAESAVAWVRSNLG